MKMLLAGGGTGGHLFPAVALAQNLLEEEPDSEVLFVGTAKGIEARVLPGMGFALQTVDIRGLVGRGLAGKLSMIPQVVKSIGQSMQILNRFRPDVVVGFGGYAAGPLLLAARLKGYPTLIHEQNAWPGLTNRILGPLVDRICLSFADSDRAFHRGRTVLTGNPLRTGMDHCPPIPEGPPSLLVFGGSRGARAINDALLEALPLLESLRETLTIVHQTGEEDLSRIREGYARAGWDHAGVVAFIDDMATAYARCHLVVCRAGATTIAELTACGRPAIMIPYPFAAGDHQTANAQALASRGAALTLPQSELSAERLARLVIDLVHDRQRLLTMGSAAQMLAHKGASRVILNECRSIAGK